MLYNPNWKDRREDRDGSWIGFSICVGIIGIGVWTFFAIKISEKAVDIQYQKARAEYTVQRLR